jgi:hypothetical protein
MTNGSFSTLLSNFPVEPSVERPNPSSGVYTLVLTGVERMTSGTDLDFKILLGGMCVDNVAAGAGDGSFFPLGMDTLFHFATPFLY